MSDSNDASDSTRTPALGRRKYLATIAGLVGAGSAAADQLGPNSEIVNDELSGDPLVQPSNAIEDALDLAGPLADRPDPNVIPERYYAVTDAGKNADSIKLQYSDGESYTDVPIKAPSIDTVEANNEVYVSGYGTDAQAFIDAVADAEPGSTVVFDALDGGAAFSWDQMVKVTKRVTIVQRGDIRLADGTLGGAGDTALTISASGATFFRESGEWDGNGANNTGELIQGRGAGVDLINPVVRDAPGVGVDLVNNPNMRAVNPTIIDTYKHGVRNFGADSSQIINPTVRNPAGRANNYMVYITNSPQDAVIDGGTIRGGPNTRQGISTDTSPEGLEATGFTVTGDFTERSVNFEGCIDSALEGVVRNNSLARGVLCSGTEDCEIDVKVVNCLKSGIHALNDTASEFSGCCVRGCGDTAQNADAAGLLLEGCIRTRVLGGIYRDNDERGVRIIDSASVSPADHCRVEDITAYDGGTGVQAYGISTGANVNGTSILHNDLRGNVTAGKNLNGTNAITDPVGQGTTEDYNIS